MRRWGVAGPGASAKGLAALLATTGVAHFVAPRFFDPLVPSAVPGAARTWVLVSGVAELGCAAAVAMPRHRRLGARLAALLFVVVFPGNVQMALNARHHGRGQQLATLLRLPLQVPLVVWAVRVSRTEPPE
jgi:uncharacterized membrane protein